MTRKKMSLQSKIESLLFVSPEPLALKELARLTSEPKDKVEEALEKLRDKYRSDKASGIILIETSDTFQLVTAPQNAALVSEFLKGDMTGELTDPSLETLTIIAYRGPITKPELEQIRGVNCGLILRNLSMRGLIIIHEERGGLPRYEASAEFVRFLGLRSVKDLPDYQKLHEHATIAQVMAATEKEEAT
ncbi:MAG: SMC-Scp complex subunit ScpB [Candidatus Komeilibacteria bacterium RIFCSPLOWO2_02_FULL_48_11]|uniref:SMC-Scp complex subunit ScpB n=1 Tax=Candidatus Komeilibacteria bacterium RIFCSPLOWO2_02_FULL_48_11 TaxID=1798553 RepID=A0A1G2BXZ4_9BACT|nr:MAG: SMC-Scp complex subunit ScpB [Candidatus Komeilibacteria bacterium RIFCSPLOWO2_02_FULL_48_11]